MIGKKKKQKESLSTHYYRQVQPYGEFFTLFYYLLVAAVSITFAKITETFLRKDFGERYYKIDFLVLVIFYMLFPYISIIDNNMSFERYYRICSRVLWEGFFNWTWLAFTIFLFVVAIKRYREIDRHVVRYDDRKYSRSNGESINFMFRLAARLPLNLKKHPVGYYIERYLEGGLFVASGLVLILLYYTRAVGVLLILSGLSHMLSMRFRYMRSRDMILDKIDDKILNEELYDTLMNEKSSKGFKWEGPRPEDPEFAESIAQSLIDYDEEETSMVS